VESLGLMRNSIIVFVADHGTMMGEQGQLHKGERRLRTQCTHVPLMVCAPGLTAGRRINGFVQHTDVMPTVLGLLGVKAPARVTGRSLQPLMASGEAARTETGKTGRTPVTRAAPRKPRREMALLIAASSPRHNRSGSCSRRTLRWCWAWLRSFPGQQR